MQVRTFKGPSAKTVLAMIKAELGPDAVILSSRDCSGEGVSWCEMTAGVERGAPEAVPRMGRDEPAAGADGSPAGWGEWHREWDEIKGHLMALMKPALRLDELAPRQRVALEYLEREGVDDKVILALYKHLRSAPAASVLEPLSKVVPVRSWSSEGWPQKVQLVCGPYGTGKTSAVIRMALALRKREPSARVCLVNVDSQRGSGRMMLRHYAELCGMDYREVSGHADVNELSRMSDEYDKIIIDMSGLGRTENLTAALNKNGLAVFLEQQDCAIQLVMSPLYGDAQLRAFLRQYAYDVPCGLVWTKLDEACNFGALVNLSASTGLPVSTLSYGPGLKNSLVPAREAMIWRLVFKKQLPGDVAAR
ncbi:flagellar biosynthesis protein FlhF [Oleidesulfovibrio sp.]|uniref:flagellar biosynthesis protein FlhF n=1 Tax=Oleidesulfovibrio sp. TaxID=2909707 RepID=UPI003A8A5598